MINRLVNEVTICLQNELYMSALTTVLILPDICGKAEYPTYGSKRRYVEWLKNNIDVQLNLISVEEIYQFRCCMLHQGSPTIKASEDSIDEFELLIQSPNRASKTMQAIYQAESKRILTVNIESICEILCLAAGLYYKKNKAKFNFINYHLVNTDYRTAKMFRLSKDFVKVKL